MSKDYLRGRGRRRATLERRNRQSRSMSVEALEQRLLLWAPFTHIAASKEVLNDVSDGNVIIAGNALPVSPAIVNALHDFPEFYNAGVIGPDGFPDLGMGQAIIHPESTG